MLESTRMAPFGYQRGSVKTGAPESYPTTSRLILLHGQRHTAEVEQDLQG